MDIERRTAANTAIVLIAFITGFAPLIGSQTIIENVAGGRALVQIARTYDVPLVVSSGPREDPRGVLYPQIAEVLEDHPIVYRGLSFDAFEDEGFEQAVAATGRRHLLIAGLMTDGCVMHTTISALRKDYEVSVVVDATATEKPTTHDAALTRFTQLGVTLRSWLSLASEFQGSYANTDTLADFRQIQSNMPGYAMLNGTIGNVREILANVQSEAVGR